MAYSKQNPHSVKGCADTPYTAEDYSILVVVAIWLDKCRAISNVCHTGNVDLGLK